MKYKKKAPSFNKVTFQGLTPTQQRLIVRAFLGIAIFVAGMLLGNCISGGERATGSESAEESATYVQNEKKAAAEEAMQAAVPELIAPSKEELADAKKQEKTDEKQGAKAEEIKEKTEEPAVEAKVPIDSSYMLNQASPFFSKKLDNLLRTYRPDYAVYLVVDAKTNEILAWGERKDGEIQTTPDYLSRTTFPAASLIKTVTVAAALESKQYALNTEIPLIGRSHTLYKNQLNPKEGKTYPMITLQDAYAQSSNPPMALVGYKVGARALKNAAAKLGYNQAFPQNAPNKANYAPPDTGYALAEIASGFNELTTLSPLLAAAQIRAILMKRPLEIPHAKGIAPFAPEKAIALQNTKFSDNTYYGLKQAMLRSVTHGTARKQISTKNMSRKSYDELYIGGKTGSLDGSDPKGRYEWFAGFAQKKDNPDDAIVLVIMQVHKEIRSQPATQVAAVIFNYWANNTRVKK